MAFNSIVFLWYFFPISFLIYHIVPKKAKNSILVIISMIFYIWGGGNLYFSLLIIAIVVSNYVSGILIEKLQNKGVKKGIFIACILFNLSFLVVFKYLDFILLRLNGFLGLQFSALNLLLPLGISFFTFSALTYIIDVYLKKVPAEKNFIDLALYISFFPKLIMGPIVKYRDMKEQLKNRQTTMDGLAYGIKRFIYGLSKKVIIADILALTADKIFSYDVGLLTTPAIIMGVILYSLQLYYDFSGYSDMAIGIAKMFGFDLMENFNYPYISQSIKEFWRRWHISLSSWFRDYIYIPLGGNRKGLYRTYFNLSIVFILTGIWHGATFNFWLWGIYHGFFIIIERLFLGKWLEKNKLKFINVIYTITVVFVGWAIFRCTSLHEAFYILENMFTSHPNALLNLSFFMNNQAWFTLLLAVVFSGFIQSICHSLNKVVHSHKLLYSELIVQFCLLAYCLLYVITGTYNSFIYFKF